MGYYTYSFDTGTGKRRRGHTEDPDRRRQEHEREFPNMKDWRMWPHSTKQAMLNHEKQLHSYDE